MAKGQMRPSKEERKPKADKNMKKKGPATGAQPQVNIGSAPPPPMKKM